MVTSVYLSSNRILQTALVTQTPEMYYQTDLQLLVFVLLEKVILESLNEKEGCEYTINNIGKANSTCSAQTEN